MLTWHLVLVYILMLLYIYIAPGQGQTSPWGQNFDVNRNFLSLCSFVASLKKKISLKSDFYRFLCVFFPHVYSARQGQTTHWGQKFYDNREAFSLCPYVASFKMIFSKSDFIHIFVAKDPRFLQADSKDSDQTGRIPRLIWVFAGHTCHFVGFVMMCSLYNCSNKCPYPHISHP